MLSFPLSYKNKLVKKLFALRKCRQRFRERERERRLLQLKAKHSYYVFVLVQNQPKGLATLGGNRCPPPPLRHSINGLTPLFIISLWGGTIYILDTLYISYYTLDMGH